MNNGNWLVGAVAALALTAAPAMAKDNWKLGTAGQPGTVLYDTIMDFIGAHNKAFEGKRSIEYQLIVNEQEMTQQVIRGRIQVGATSLAGAGVAVPEGTVLNMPYVWESDPERVYVTDNFALPVLKDIYASKGLVLFSVADVGWNDVVCNWACLTPGDVKGQKMRISPSPASKLFFQALGANGVQMPLSEFFPGLTTGLVRGGDLPFLYYVTTPAAQSAPHYVVTRHYHHPSAWIINKALFEKLSPADRDAFVNAVPPVQDMRRRVDQTEKPKMEEFTKKGGFVHHLSDAQREEWAKPVRPIQAEMVKSIGGRAQEVYDAILRGKKEYADRFGKKS